MFQISSVTSPIFIIFALCLHFTVVLIALLLLDVDNRSLFYQHPLHKSSPNNSSLLTMVTHKSTRNRKPLTSVSTDHVTTTKIRTVIHWLTVLFCLAAMITFIYYRANHIRIPDDAWGVLACFFVAILVVQLIIFLLVRSYKKRITGAGNRAIDDTQSRRSRDPNRDGSRGTDNGRRTTRSRERRLDRDQNNRHREKGADWGPVRDQNARRAAARSPSNQWRLIASRLTEKFGNACEQYELKRYGRIPGRNWSSSRNSIERLRKEEKKAIEGLVEEGRLEEYRKAKREREMNREQEAEGERARDGGMKWTVWPFAQQTATSATKDERGRTVDRHGESSRDHRRPTDMTPKRPPPTPPAQQSLGASLNPFYGASTSNTNIPKEVRAVSSHTLTTSQHIHLTHLEVPRPAHYRSRDRSPKAADGAVGNYTPYQPKEAKNTAFPAPSSLARPQPPQPTQPILNPFAAHPVQKPPQARLPHRDPMGGQKCDMVNVIKPTPPSTNRRKQEENATVIGYGGEGIVVNMIDGKSDEEKEKRDGKESNEKEERQRKKWGSLPQGVVGTGLLAHPTESVLSGYTAWHPRMNDDELSKANGKDHDHDAKRGTEYEEIEYIAWNPSTKKQDDIRRMRTKRSYDEEHELENWRRRDLELGFGFQEVEEMLPSQNPRTRLEREEADKRQKEEERQKVKKEKTERAARYKNRVREHTKELKLEAAARMAGEERKVRETQKMLTEMHAKEEEFQWQENQRVKEKEKEDVEIVEVLRRKLKEREVKEDSEYVERLMERNRKAQESRKDWKRKGANSANVSATEKTADEIQQMMAGSKRPSLHTDATLPSAPGSDATRMFDEQPPEKSELQRTKRLEREYGAFEGEQARKDLEEALNPRKAKTLSMWEKDYRRDRGSSFGAGSQFTSFTGFTDEGSVESKHSMGSQEMIAEVQTNMRTLEKRIEEAGLNGNWFEQKGLKAEIKESRALLEEYRALAAGSGNEKGAHVDPAQRVQDPRIPGSLPGMFGYDNQATKNKDVSKVGKNGKSRIPGSSMERKAESSGK